MFASSIAVARVVDIAAQSDLSLTDVLDRLGNYLANYSDQLSRTVANERYKQTSGSGNSYSEARLESEFGIVKVPDYPGWLGFRDVQKVNGRAVQDRESRLQQLYGENHRIEYGQSPSGGAAVTISIPLSGRA